MKRFFNLKGQTLIELLLAMGLAALIFPTLLAGFMSSREGKVQQTQRLQAVAILKETEQAVKSVREGGWSTFINITHDAPYHPEISNSKWVFVSGTQTSSGFTRQVVMSNVYRNTNGAIVTSGGTNDPSTKKIVITISWTQPNSSSVTSTLYLTRTTNLTHKDDLYSDFNSGIKSSVVVATTSGFQTDGQVQLGAGGGGGDWCNPSFLIDTVDLPKSGVANAVTAIVGPATNESTVFAGTGENASGVSFAKVDLPGNPPVVPNPPTPVTFDGYKTNAVFGESGYAYLATDNNAKEIEIIDLNTYGNPPTNSKYAEAGSINLPGNVNGSSVFVANNKVYVTSSDSKFYIYDISTTKSPTSPLNSGGLTLDGVGKKVLVAGGYAYIATNSTTYPLEIVDISTPTSPHFAGSGGIQGKLGLGTGQSGVDVYVNTAGDTTRAYLATSQSASHYEFYIVNVSDKTNPKTTNESSVTLGKYDTAGMTPTGLTIVTGNRAIIVGTGGAYQYQVVNISTETADPVTHVFTKDCGHLAYATGIRGVASVLQGSGFAYSYVITGDASSELKIILGGGGGVYTSSGTFISAFYDPGYSTAYNRFSVTVSQPSQTTLKMQVAVATPDNGGSCTGAAYDYVGPNGDPSQYFTPVGSVISGIIPYGNYDTSYQNPERCFKYKAWFTSSDINQTPIIYDFTANYSP